MRLPGIWDDALVALFLDADTFRCEHCLFHVASVVVHYAEMAQTGHYRCLWHKSDCTLLTDDAISAVSCHAEQLSAAQCNSYRVWLVRASIPRRLDVVVE